MLSEWEEVNISLENFKFWWDTRKTLGEEEDNIIRLLLPLVRALPPLDFQQLLWALLLQTSAYWTPNRSFCTKSCAAIFGDCVGSGISILLPVFSPLWQSSHLGLLLQWRWSPGCSGPIPQAGARLPTLRPSVLGICQSSRVPTKDLKWSFLREKDYTTHCHSCVSVNRNSHALYISPTLSQPSSEHS